VAQLEIDARTARALEFAARMANVTPAQLVARLVDQASLPTPYGEAGGSPPSTTAEHRVAIYADYEGFRTRALFDPGTSRVDITSGPLEGRSHKSPTGAAGAVVGHYKPTVSPHRNGWSFWFIDDGSGRMLQSIRGS